MLMNSIDQLVLGKKIMNSPACVRTEAVVEGREIHLTIVSGPGRGPVATICPAAKLGDVAPGAYRVFYRGPNEAAVPLKDVELKR